MSKYQNLPKENSQTLLTNRNNTQYKYERSY